MNPKLIRLLNDGANFTQCRELAEKEFSEAGEDINKIDQDSRSILLVWWLSMEFVGGGVEMYLRGVCADYHYDILELLKEIGAHDLRKILSSAEGLFEERSIPLDRATRNRKIDESFDDSKIDSWDRLRESIDCQYENSVEDSSGILLLKYLANKMNLGNQQ